MALILVVDDEPDMRLALGHGDCLITGATRNIYDSGQSLNDLRLAVHVQQQRQMRGMTPALEGGASSSAWKAPTRLTIQTSPGLTPW